MADARSSPSGAVDEVDAVEEQKNLSKEQAAESKQLDAVTDFAEEEVIDMSKAEAVRSDPTRHDHTHRIASHERHHRCIRR
jgi:hypothetical protein